MYHNLNLFNAHEWEHFVFVGLSHCSSQVFAELIPDALESLSASATGHIVTISVATMVGLQLVLENAVH